MSTTTKFITTVDNNIPRDIRNIFPDIKDQITPEFLTENIIIDQFLEKTEDIAILNLVDSEKSISDLTEIAQVDDLNLKGISWANIGGIHTFNGDYKKAFSTFEVALDLTVDNNVKSFIYAELSNLLRKLGYLKESISVLNAASTITTNNRLKWRINTLMGLCNKYSDPELSEKLLLNSLQYYVDISENFRRAGILRNIGELYINRSDYKQALEYLNSALKISKDNNMTQIIHEVNNDLGWLYIAKKDYSTARKVFSSVIKREISPYLLSLALQNLGYLEFETKHYRKAINYHSQSLQINLKYYMRDLAFEDYYKLGTAYEQLKEDGLAYHFYSHGYQLLQTEMDINLPIIGYRRKVVDSYINFLSKNQKLPYVNTHDEALKFVIDKTMKDIRYVFHKALFTMQLQRHKNAPVLCKAMDIDTRTYFLYQKKLDLKRGRYDDSQFENLYFRQYIEALLPYTWREANHKFEDDLFDYLLEKYGHNKKKIAEILNVSYPQVVMKTQDD